ncbi:hypothetical protein [Bosea sp. (in: a-proteobacteria)]|uniref:hypothetical protein n=1 Tax=Bosea sp. (in: a-proteobacteria) TaxID=1871050 RepID=UPI0025BAB235|nr:hypothetical protein [Bosea sp. (in: a-proteobacteria)]
MAEAFYHGAPGAGQYPVRHPHFHIPHNAFTPPQVGHFEVPRQTQIIHPLIYVPRIVLGSPAEVAGLLSAPALQVPGAYLHLKLATPLDRAEVRVGEGSNVARRLQQSIDGWVSGDYSTTVVIVCDHPAFNKVSAETVEHRLTALLESSSYLKVQRDRSPKVRQLSDAEHRAIDNMISIAAQELSRVGLNILCLPRPHVQPEQEPVAPQRAMPRDLVSDMLSRLDLTRPPRVPEPTQVSPPKPIKCRPERWTAPRYNLHYDEQFGVLRKLGDTSFEIAAGTQVSATEVPALNRKYRAIRKDLIDQGAIGRDRERGDGLIALRAITVRSGTIAAAVVSGSTKASTRVWQPV